MKVSLISTILNEESGIKDFLDSIIKQTKKPNEVIIVDGGSTDNTVKIIKNYTKKYKWIKLIVSKGASIGKGRNIAIEKAKNEIIACADAGCILDKNWLKEITKFFPSFDVVVGVYKPYYTNDFEYFEGLVTVPKEEKIFEKPSRWSSRSIAFKKEIWKKVNGYPDLSAGEDTGFNLKLLKLKPKIAFAKNAIVYWRMRKNWKEFFKQFYKYGVGDRKSGNIWKMKNNLLLVVGFWCYIGLSICFLFISFKIFTIMLLLPLIYSLLSGVKLTIKSGKMNGIFYGFLLTLVKRFSYILGVSVGR
ncbi:MAG: glycosyltransferase [Candidatus Aenigmatarchaeota archaeon]